MKPGFTAQASGHSSSMAKTMRYFAGASMIVLALSLAPLALAQTTTTTTGTTAAPAAQTSNKPDAQQAYEIIKNAVGGNKQEADKLINALGGDPIAAMNAITNGGAGNKLGNAMGGENALAALTKTLGNDNAVAAMIDKLGQNGSLNTLLGKIGGQDSVDALARSLLGNSSSLASFQSALGGNQDAIRALQALAGGNSNALGDLTKALGGTDAAASKIIGALGLDNALSSLTDKLGGNAALSALADALGINSALNALVGQLREKIAAQLEALGMTALCGIAPLTGTFAEDACEETKDREKIKYAQEEPGGKEVEKQLEKTFTDRLLPAMKDRTAQLHAGVVDQTRQLGTIAEAAQVADVKRDIEKQELESRKELDLHEQTCALPTNAPALAYTHRAAAELARGLTKDFMDRTNPIPGTTAARGYSAVVDERYDNYCARFLDPDDNNGVTACTRSLQEKALQDGQDTAQTGNGQTAQDDAPATAAMPNGDIDIENILLRDTIDLDEEAQLVSIEAILDNLLQLRPYPPMKPEGILTAQGREWQVRKERIETVRKIAADTISGIVARRTAIPLPQMISEGKPLDTQQGGPSGQCYVPADAGDNNSKALAFAQKAESEKRVYMEGKVTYCQRFAFQASGKTPPPAKGGGNAESALAAWKHFSGDGGAARLAQPWDPELVRPGDLVYLIGKHPTRVNKAGKTVVNNGHKYGHVGIYSGRGLYHVYTHGQVMHTEMPLNNYNLLGFVRPSGVNENVADCSFDYNTVTTPEGKVAEGTGSDATIKPGAPTQITEGPRAGQSTDTPVDPNPPSRETPAVNAEPPLKSSAETKSRGNYDAYLTALGKKESSFGASSAGACNNGSKINYSGPTGPGYQCVNTLGYVGKYQMHTASSLADIGCSLGKNRWKNCLGNTLRDAGDFLNNGNLQETAILEYNKKQWNYIKSAHSAMCHTINGMVMTPSGMLAGAHLMGHGGLKKFVRSQGKDVPSDGYGTNIMTYIHKFGGYTVPFGTGNCPGDMVAAFGPGTAPSGSTATDSELSLGGGYSDYYTPPPPRPVGEIVREIRQRAGIPDHEIGSDPSYNEIMLAMTKERFFDPRFFTEIAGSMPAMRGNEIALDAYIALTLQDIKLVQEQINALAAARASLRIEELESK